MPVILHPKDFKRWLSRDEERPPVDLLRPYESEEMKAARCNKLVGEREEQWPEMLKST
jgi:putative SOS response-associated peptidase YedK